MNKTTNGHTPKTLQVNKRELDTIIAALRAWQYHTDKRSLADAEGAMLYLDSIARDSGRALSSHGIDYLVERINT